MNGREGERKGRGRGEEGERRGRRGERREKKERNFYLFYFVLVFFSSPLLIVFFLFLFQISSRNRIALCQATLHEQALFSADQSTSVEELIKNLL